MNNNQSTIRRFYPGGKWLYFKLYTSHQHAEHLLVHNIIDYTEKLLSQDLIDKWFFIRYEDPEPHLRLRLRLTSVMDYNNIYSLFEGCFKDELSLGKIWKVQVDTYVRELERYGIDTMDTLESIFYRDSVCIANLLKQISSDPSRDTLRWNLGLSIIDHLFDAFSYDLCKRSNVISQMSDSFLKEFYLTSSQYTKPLNDKFRNNSILIDSIISNQYQNICDMSFSLDAYSNEIREEIKKIVDPALDQLVFSIIHMSMNRLFISNNRANELVIYYLLSKYYKSLIGRQRYDK